MRGLSGWTEAARGTPLARVLADMGRRALRARARGSGRTAMSMAAAMGLRPNDPKAVEKMLAAKEGKRAKKGGGNNSKEGECKRIVDA